MFVSKLFVIHKFRIPGVLFVALCIENDFGRHF